jgi:hypothetical protein
MQCNTIIKWWWTRSSHDFTWHDLKFIYFFSVVDPHWNADSDSGTWWQKIVNIYSWKKIIFKNKIWPPWRTFKQQEKPLALTRDYLAFQNINFHFSFLWALFSFFDPDPDTSDQNQYGSMDCQHRIFVLSSMKIMFFWFSHSNNGDLPACFNIFTEQREYPPPPPPPVDRELCEEILKYCFKEVVTMQHYLLFPWNHHNLV